MSPSSPSHDQASDAREDCRSDLTTGTLPRSDGQRCAALSIDFVRSIHVALMEQLGDSSQDILYRSGFEWGLQEMLRLNQGLHAESGGEKAALWKGDARAVFAAWWQPLQETGWGKVALDFSRVSRGIVVADLRHSVIAAALDGVEQPVCHCYAGLFAGGLSFFQREERHAAEIECQALGHPTCKFVIGSSADIDAVESSRQRGVTVADILRQLG